MERWRRLMGLVVVAGSLVLHSPAYAESLPNLFPFPNAAGFLETYNTAGGPISLSRPVLPAVRYQWQKLRFVSQASPGLGYLERRGEAPL